MNKKRIISFILCFLLVLPLFSSVLPVFAIDDIRSITVKAVWNDEDNKDERRPDKLKLYLEGYRADSSVACQYSQIVTEEDGWECTFEVPNMINSETVEYHVGCYLNFDNLYYDNITTTPEGDEYTVTITHTKEENTIPEWAYNKMNLLLKIRWGNKDKDSNEFIDTDEDKDSRPEYLNVTLHAHINDGDETSEDESLNEHITLSEENNWEFRKNDVPEYYLKETDGDISPKYISYYYTFEDEDWKEALSNEETVGNHKLWILADGGDTTIDNKKYESFIIGATKTETRTRNVIVKNVWNDDDNSEGLRPDVLRVFLDEYGDHIRYFTASEENDWTYTKKDLPKDFLNVNTDEYEDIEYTANLSSQNFNYFRDIYETEQTQSVDEDGNLVITLTHTHEPIKNHVLLYKTWSDKNDKDGIRPDSVTIHLLYDGKEIDKTTLSKDNNWEGSFDNLPAYDGSTKILDKYSIVEDDIEGYTTTIEKIEDNDDKLYYEHGVTYYLNSTHTVKTDNTDNNKISDNDLGSDETTETISKDDDAGSNSSTEVQSDTQDTRDNTVDEDTFTADTNSAAYFFFLLSISVILPIGLYTYRKHI